MPDTLIENVRQNMSLDALSISRQAEKALWNTCCHVSIIWDNSLAIVSKFAIAYSLILLSSHSVFSICF